MDFNPSSANFAKVFLWADAAHPDSIQNGLWLRIGGDTEDRLSLFERIAGSDQLRIASPDDWLDRNALDLRIRVSVDSVGACRLQSDSGSAAILVDLGTALIQSPPGLAGFFLWQCTYTSTRSKAFHLDTISVSGSACADGMPPRLLEVRALDSFKLEVRFDEPLDPVVLEDAARYQLSDPSLEVVLSAGGPDHRTALLFLSDNLSWGAAYQLKATLMSDPYGNQADTLGATFRWGSSPVGALVINEIMADPDPPWGWPAHEYLEVFNPTYAGQSTRGWSLVVGRDSLALPELFLPPNATALWVAEDVRENWPLAVHELPLSEPWLPNSGTRLVLRDDEGKLMDWVEYKNTWHTAVPEPEGGRSLERIDPHLSCAQEGNWQTSNDPRGGSPGISNAGAPPSHFNRQMRALRWFWSQENTLAIEFSLGLGWGSEAGIPAVVIDPDPGWHDVFWDETRTRLHLRFFNSLVASQLYTLRFDTLCCDCRAQSIPDQIIPFGIPEMPQTGDVVVSEILFEPFSNQEEFVELWNASGHMVQLSDLRLARLDPITLDILSFDPEFENELLPPGKGLVLGRFEPSGQAATSCSDPSRWRAYPLHSLSNEGGALGLFNAEQTVLDRAVYHPDFHFFRLEDPSGFSLNRALPNPQAIDASAWTSSPSRCAGQSPGVWNPEPIVAPGVQVVNPQFSPNGDGYKDELRVSVDLPRGNYALEWTVFSIGGQAVAHIPNPVLSDGYSLLEWNGALASGSTAPPGLYQLQIRAQSGPNKDRIWWFPIALIP